MKCFFKLVFLFLIETCQVIKQPENTQFTRSVFHERLWWRGMICESFTVWSVTYSRNLTPFAQAKSIRGYRFWLSFTAFITRHRQTKGLQNNSRATTAIQLLFVASDHNSKSVEFLSLALQPFSKVCQIRKWSHLAPLFKHQRTPQSEVIGCTK